MLTQQQLTSTTSDKHKRDLGSLASFCLGDAIVINISTSSCSYLFTSVVPRTLFIKTVITDPGARRAMFLACQPIKYKKNPFASFKLTLVFRKKQYLTEIHSPNNGKNYKVSHADLRTKYLRQSHFSLKTMEIVLSSHLHF